MSLEHLIDRLATFEPTGFPVISLYLNTQADDRGRDHFQPFVRKEFNSRAKTFAARSSEKESFDRDVERISNYLENELRPSANGVVIFACSGANDFFEALQLDAPVERNRLFISEQPQMYPLARLMDQYPRYAALIANNNSARLFVFGLGKPLKEQTITGVNVNHTKVGGWSQARYQRHVENYHEQHAKEVIEELTKLVSEEQIEHIVLAGDEVIVPSLREQMSQQLQEKVVDVLRMDISAPETEILKATLEAMREQDAKSDLEKVERMKNQYRAGGLATTGARETLAALEIGQVDELIISATRADVRYEDEEVSKPLAAIAAASEAMNKGSHTLELADELVAKAKQTGARVTFIEDSSLLNEVGGVGAILRFRL